MSPQCDVHKEALMKLRSLTDGAIIVWIALLPALPLQLVGQEGAGKHRHYKLVEIATFGGAWSGYNAGPIANRNGMVAGAADTAEPDPYAPNCWNFSCLVTHAWEWQNGVQVDLGALPAGFSSWTNAINAQGLIVGQSQDGQIDLETGVPSYVPVAWKNGKIIDLGTFGGSFGLAAAVNDGGVVVGIAENAMPDPTGFAAANGIGGATELRAFRWTGGTLSDLGTLGGPGAFPLAIDSSGQVVGLSLAGSVPGPTGLPTVAPFLWAPSHKMRNLGTLGGTFGAAVAINSSGQVAGTSNLQGDQTAHPFLWQHGSLGDLGTLGGSFATANWMNDPGEVIGFSFLVNDEVLHAFLWRQGRMIDLGTVEGDASSNAFGINNRGQVVGQSWFWDGHQVTASHAFLWEHCGPMVDLNTLVSNPTDLYLTEANFITESGLIVANGVLPNGDGRAAILIPEGESGKTDNELMTSDTLGIRQQHRSFTPEMQAHVNSQSGRRYGRGSMNRFWWRKALPAH
jgi:probable HAF family extracellular repeat protein